MEIPDLIFVTGCNASGKSSLIRTHLSLFPDYEVIMTDVYKARSQEVFKSAIATRKSIILETPFNNESFKDLIDFAKNSGYRSSLIFLFLTTPSQSIERVAARQMFENGLPISAGNVEYNFVENFKNVATYFHYFDESFFVYTGEKGRNQLIIKFQQGNVFEYKSNDLAYIQKFAEYSHSIQRLDRNDFEIIAANKDYSVDSPKDIPSKGFTWA